MPTSDRNCALICSCSQRGLIPSSAIVATKDELTSQGWQVTVVPDLCEMATNDACTLRNHAATQEFLLAACRPRATRWILHQAGVSRPASQIQFMDIRPRLSSPATTRIPEHTGTHADSPPWPAWFPVIDYNRCTGCRQCVSFCAFGVYTVSGKTVNVTAPSNCKDNCPACARICPVLAIIFPKVAESPINGDEITASHLEAMKSALSASKHEMASGDLQSILASRRSRVIEPHQDRKASPHA